MLCNQTFTSNVTQLTSAINCWLYSISTNTFANFLNYFSQHYKVLPTDQWSRWWTKPQDIFKSF